MDELRVGAGVRKPGAFAGEQAGGRCVGGGVGQREAHALEVEDPLAELDALRCPLDRQSQQPLHRPGTAGTDVDAFLHEPLVGQLVRAPYPTEHRRLRDADVLQHELGMPVRERVRVVRVVLEREAGRVVVDQEQGREAELLVDDEAVEDHEVRVIRAGDEPFLTVEQVLPGGGVADGGRAEGASIGAGLVLRDRVTPGALAAQARVEIAPALLSVGMDQHVVRARDVRPEAAGGLPELLVDQHLLQNRPALSAHRTRQGAAVESSPDGRPADRVPPIAWDPAVRALEFDFAWLEHIAHEAAGTRLELELGVGEGQVHLAKDAPPGPRLADRVADLGTRRSQRNVKKAGRTAHPARR